MGDIPVVFTRMLCAMYVFELFYQAKVSPIGSVHHISAIVIAQSSLAINLDEAREKDATIEYILIIVWGVSNYRSFMYSLYRH